MVSEQPEARREPLVARFTDLTIRARPKVDAQRTLLEADISRKKRKKVVDKLAAVLLLQNYMEAKRSR